MRRARVFVWQWGRFGAGPRLAAELAGALRHVGVDATLSLSKSAEAFADLGGLCTNQIALPGPRSAAGMALRAPLWPATLGILAYRLRRQGITAAVNAMPGFLDPAMAMWLRKAGIPLTTIVHEISAHPGDRHGLLYRLQRSQLRRSQRVVVLSRFVRDQIKAQPGLLGHHTELQTLFHPAFSFADLDLPAVRPLVPNAEGPLRLLVAGRLRAYKGVETAIAAVDRLPSGAVTLEIVGRPGDEPWVEHARQHPAIVTAFGWQSESDLIAAVDRADLVLFPYNEASQSGLVPLCQSRSRPVLITPVGGLVDQVSHGIDGLIAPGTDPAAIVGTIRPLLYDREALAALGDRARRTVLSTRSWDIFARHLIGR